MAGGNLRSKSIGRRDRTDGSAVPAAFIKHLINTLKEGVGQTCYLATRGDSSVKRRQPLVIFGVDPGSLKGRRQ